MISESVCNYNDLCINLFFDIVENMNLLYLVNKNFFVFVNMWFQEPTNRSNTKDDIRLISTKIYN